MTKNQSYDVVIVGAGPAGLLMGKQLQNRGLETIILEKSDEIKPNAEYIIINQNY